MNHVAGWVVLRIRELSFLATPHAATPCARTPQFRGAPREL